MKLSNRGNTLVFTVAPRLIAFWAVVGLLIALGVA